MTSAELNKNATLNADMNETNIVEVADNENATEEQTGNLTQDDLLNYLGGESTEEVAESPALQEDEPTESEEVLSQSNDETQESEPEEESDQDSDEGDDDKQPKSVQKLLKQIGRLTARSKSAEEAVEALTAQVQSMQLDKKVEENPTIQEAQNLSDIEQLKQEALSAKKWARMHEDEDIVTEGEKEYTREERRQILQSAEEHLEELIPAREKFLQLRGQSEELAVKDFPFLQLKDSDEFKLFKNTLNDPNLQVLDQLPNGVYLRALMVEGVNAVKARGAKTAKRPSVLKKSRPKPPPPKSPDSDVSPPLKNRSSSSDARKKILGEGNITQEQLTAFLSQS